MLEFNIGRRWFSLCKIRRSEWDEMMMEYGIDANWWFGLTIKNPLSIRLAGVELTVIR